MATTRGQRGARHVAKERGQFEEPKLPPQQRREMIGGFFGQDGKPAIQEVKYLGNRVQVHFLSGGVLTLGL